MRITSLNTLGYYLQEVACESVLSGIPAGALENVKALRAYYKASLGMQG